VLSHATHATTRNKKWQQSVTSTIVSIHTIYTPHEKDLETQVVTAILHKNQFSPNTLNELNREKKTTFGNDSGNPKDKQ
jgi:replication initiation and membrane attachment protein DnaB